MSVPTHPWIRMALINSQYGVQTWDNDVDIGVAPEYLQWRLEPTQIGEIFMIGVYRMGGMVWEINRL